MKKLRVIVTVLFISMILGGMTSCEVSRHSDEGRHRGWFQKQDNDHHRKGAVLIIKQDSREQRSHDDDDD